MTTISLSFDSGTQNNEIYNLPGLAELIEVRVTQYYPASGMYADGSFVSRLYISTGEEREGITYWNDIRRSFNRHFNQIIVPWYEKVNTISVTGYKRIAGEIKVFLREEESRERILLFDTAQEMELVIPMGAQDLKVEPFHQNSYAINGVTTKGLYSRQTVRKTKTLVFPQNSGEYSVNYLGV